MNNCARTTSEDRDTLVTATILAPQVHFKVRQQKELYTPHIELCVDHDNCFVGAQKKFVNNNYYARATYEDQGRVARGR